MTASFAFETSFGAVVQSNGTTRFRIWAPGVNEITLEIAGRAPLAMQREPDGIFTTMQRVSPGTRYHYRLMDGMAVPDPASRLQAEDVSGPSVVVDPHAYVWRVPLWRGRPWHETVLYELHVGACGGYAGVKERLPYLKDVGITAIELMPLADFPGTRNWGYDGVLPYAPDNSYGTPEEL
jgi:maltooligosyltrehalose trehalohydrolase